MPTVEEQPIINTSKGSVRGYVRQTVYDDLFYCFEGIPYGKPPLGELRFKSPVEVEPWTNILNCTEVAPKAVQYNRYNEVNEGSEDCLYLNIYAKQLKSDKPLPVMVYIHGGFFCTGNASRLAWGPDYFIKRDVIFITVGYRLGALGFLSLKDPELQIPGNAGLKDIVLALKWVQKNVHNFNGDPQNVTVFGHSSGSVAAHLLMLSDKTKGLFHKAILMAGFAINFKPLPDMHYRMACDNGYDGENDERKILAFLQKLDASQLAKYDYHTDEERDKGNFFSFMPVSEPYETSDTIWGATTTMEMQRHCWSNRIPIMMGVTSLEGLVVYKKFSKPEAYDVYKEHPEYLLPIDIANVGGISVQRERATKLLNLNFKGKELCTENIMHMVEFHSYRIYHSTQRTLKARLAYSSAPTYFYRFDFDSPTFNLYRIKLCGPEVRGVCHVDELSYLFYLPQSFELDLNTPEYKTIIRMIDMWTAFATRTDPNVQSIKPVVWKPVERFGPRMCLNISYDVSFIDWPETQICNEWDKIYEEAELPLI